MTGLLAGEEEKETVKCFDCSGSGIYVCDEKGNQYMYPYPKCEICGGIGFL